MQSAMGFSGLNNALSSIPGLSAGAAGGIALAITAVLALSSAVAEAIDNANVSSKEYTQNLLKSNNDL
jgi:hypothetical protein